MSTLNVRIERLPAMRVAQTKAMSENAEHASIQKILTWATSRGMAADYRLFVMTTASHTRIMFTPPGSLSSRVLKGITTSTFWSFPAACLL